MFIHCYDPKKRKNVLAGEYNQVDNTFIKKAKPEHFMVIEDGYGIQEDVIQKLKEMGCINILIITKNNRYLSVLEDWLKLPIPNHGHGKQRFMPIHIPKRGK
jgi:spore coat polysaccharide biosynthesis predicted glycosyltransferase SpsG